MSVDLDFTIASAINPWVASDNGLIESNAGTLRIASNRLELINVSTTNTLTVASSTPNQSVDMIVEYSIIGDMVADDYNPILVLLYEDADNYMTFDLSFSAADDLRPRLRQRLAGTETTVGTFVSPGFTNAQLPQGVAFGLAVTWDGPDATFSLTRNGEVVGSPITVPDCPLTAGVPGYIFTRGGSAGDWVALRSLVIDNGAAPGPDDPNIINVDDSDSGAVDFHPGEAGNIVVISDAPAGATTGNTSIHFDDASGPELTVTGVSYDDTTLTVTFTIPSALATQYGDKFIYLDVNGTALTTALAYPYVPVVGNNYINLAGDVKTSPHWIAGRKVINYSGGATVNQGDHVLNAGESYYVNETGTLNSTAPVHVDGSVNATSGVSLAHRDDLEVGSVANYCDGESVWSLAAVQAAFVATPSEGVDGWSYERDAVYATDNFTDIKPLAGLDQVEFNITTSPNNHDCAVLADGITDIVAGVGTVETMQHRIIRADGILGNWATFTFATNNIVIVSFASVGVTRNSYSHPINAGVLRASETDVTVILLLNGTVVNYTTDNVTDVDGYLNNIEAPGQSVGTVLKCVVIFSNGDGVPAFNVTVIDA